LKRSIHILLLIFIGTFHLGCDKSEGWDCFKKAGDTITETRQLGAFVNVYAEGKLNIEYHYAAEPFVEVTFGENLIDDIETKVEGGSLYISNETKCNWTRNMSKTALVAIYAPTLDLFENQISGDIQFLDTLYSDVFQYDQWNANGEVSMIFNANIVKIAAHTGFANITASGDCENARIYSGAICIFNAQDLKSPNVSVNNSSIYDISCYSSGYLYGQVNLSGDIIYSGNPDQIDTDIQGSGTVRPN
jgi:hypothetical protein